MIFHRLHILLLTDRFRLYRLAGHCMADAHAVHILQRYILFLLCKLQDIIYPLLLQIRSSVD